MQKSQVLCLTLSAGKAALTGYFTAIAGRPAVSLKAPVYVLVFKSVSVYLEIEIYY